MRNSFRTWLCAVLLAIGVLFFAGGPAVGSHGILYAATGLLLLVFRPISGVPRSLAIASLVLFLACALAFLPNSLFGVPAWRQMIESHGQVHLGPLVTPQPWHTLAGLGVLAPALAFYLFLLTQPVSDERMPAIARLFTIGIGFYAGAAILCAHTGWHYPWAFDAKTFGFLASKNHTGTVLVLGALVGFGSLWHDLAAGRVFLAVPVAGSLGAIAAAVFGYCDSRGSALLLPVGLVVWFGGLLRSRMDRRVMISAAAIILVTLLLFFTSSTPARERLAALAGRVAREPASDGDSTALMLPKAAPKENVEASLDFRMLIYRDTMEMLREAPWTGVGLGNFRYIFPQFRKLSRTESQCLHPESSFLQLAAEAGIPALLAAMALVGISFSRLWKRTDRSVWPLHWALAVAVLMGITHCLFDVPGSRIGSLWPALLLAAAAFGDGSLRGAAREASMLQVIVFAALGAGLLTGGMLLISAEWRGGALPGPAGAFRVKQEVYRLYQDNKIEEAIAEVSAALRVTPLDPDLYFLRGALELRFADTEALVDDLFATERSLEPAWALNPLREGVQWLAVDENRAMSLFAEAIARADRMPPSSQYRSPLEVFLRVLDVTPGNSKLFPRLISLVKDRPALILEWLRRSPDSAVTEAIQTILSPDPSLENWNERERLQLFRRWFRSGDRAALMLALEGNSTWRDAAWPIRAGIMARTSHLKEACEMVAERMKLSLELPPVPPTESHTDLAVLRSRHEEQGTALAAERLMEGYLRESNPTAALRVADEAVARKTVSPHLSQLTAIAAGQSNSWDRAWRALGQYVQQVDAALVPE